VFAEPDIVVDRRWGEAKTSADAIGQVLLDHGLGPDRPLLILSGSSLGHLEMLLGAYTAGVPASPVSAAYSLPSQDHDRISGRTPRGDAGEITDTGYVNR
jgi:feruloyl-CoA synthase